MKLFDELKKYCDKHGVKLQIDVFRKDKNRYELTFDYYEPEELRDIRHIIADYAKIEDDIYLAGNGRAIDICFETLDESKNSSRQIKSGVNVNVLECEKDIQKLADYLYDIGRSDLVHEIDDDFDNNPPGDETSYIRKVKTWCDWRESPLVDKLEEDEWQGYLNLINSSQQIKSSRAIKSANLFAPTTPCDVMLDNGKVAPAGCEFEVSYDRNEQGEYVLGIKVQGLGKGSIRFDSEAEAKKDGWIVSKRAIKSSPNFKKFTADEIFDSFQMEELIHTVFMDREECKNAKCGMNEFSDLMYDVLPGYLGVYTADDVREVCRRAKNPKAKAFLEAFETALENAKFVDRYFGSIKLHKKANSSKKIQSDRYTLGNCSFCGTGRTKRVEDFLLEYGFNNVDFACDILDIDPEEEICEECFNGMLPELNSKYYSEYDDLGTDVRTGEPFNYPNLSDDKFNPVMNSTRRNNMIKSGKYFVQVNTDDKVLFDTLQEANVSYMQAVSNSTPDDYITIGETDGNRIIQYDSSRGMLKNSRQIKSNYYRIHYDDYRLPVGRIKDSVVIRASDEKSARDKFNKHCHYGATIDKVVECDEFGNDLIKSAYTREDYDRFDENGKYIPYKPTEEELAKKDEIKKVLEQRLSDAYEPDPMDDYAGYDSTDARIDMACERVAKQFGVDTDFVEEIAGEIQYEEYTGLMPEDEWIYKHYDDKHKFWDWQNSELDVKPLMLKNSNRKLVNSGLFSDQFKTSAWSSFGGDKLSRKLVKSDAASEQKLKEDLIRQGYTEEEATQIVTQRKPEEDQQTAGEESQWGM